MNDEPQYGERSTTSTEGPIPEPKPKPSGSRIIPIAGTILVTTFALGVAACIVLGVVLLWKAVL